MQSVTGVFRSIEAARRAAAQLRREGFSAEQVNLLLPGAGEERIHSLPTSETEQHGMGGAIGGVVGAALGMAGGFELGIGATALIPGVGPVLAIGLAAGALLGVGGAVGGAAAGNAMERETTPGIAADEVFFYEDALRQGRSVVVAFANDAAEAEKARTILADGSAESLDAAREAWWIGLRDAEAEHYRALGENFTADQDAYRRGFEAGLRRECRGKTADEARECLRDAYPDMWESKAFQVGFERGMQYRERASVEGARSQFLAG
jgi:hypothetical protein